MRTEETLEKENAALRETVNEMTESIKEKLDTIPFIESKAILLLSEHRNINFNPEATHMIIVQAKDEFNFTEAIKVAVDAGIAMEDIKIVRYQYYRQLNHNMEHKGFRAQLDIHVKGFTSKADEGTTVVHNYYVDKNGKIDPDYHTSAISKYEMIPEKEDENLRVVIRADNVEKHYSLEELLNLTGEKGEVVHFKPSNPNEKIIPDARRYTIHMKRQLPVDHNNINYGNN